MIKKRAGYPLDSQKEVATITVNDRQKSDEKPRAKGAYSRPVVLLLVRVKRPTCSQQAALSRTISEGK